MVSFNKGCNDFLYFIIMLEWLILKGFIEQGSNEIEGCEKGIIWEIGTIYGSLGCKCEQ
jgi:hypothetical protein